MNADVIVEKIDNGELSPSSHRVMRRLCDLLTYTDLADAELITAFDSGEAMDGDRWQVPLWERIWALPVDQQGPLRILSGLLIPDQQVDWELAEYLIHWARERGVADGDIIEAFGVTPQIGK